MEMVGFAFFFVFGSLAGFFYAMHKFDVKEKGPHGSPGGGGSGPRPE